MTIRIIKGTYGWRDKTGAVKPIAAGCTCEVTADQGARAISLGVAEEVTAFKPAPAAPAEKPAKPSKKKPVKADAEPDLTVEGDIIV